MGKHTPGPWVLENPVGPSFKVHGVKKRRTLTPVAWVAKLENGEADARLIAAAPDLLAALKACVATCDCAAYELDPTQCEHAHGRAAIAKAEGK